MESKRINEFLYIICVFLTGLGLISDGLKNELQCQNWNATIITKGDSLDKLVQAMFWPHPGYEKCFAHYFVYLHQLKPKRFECSIDSGVGIKLKKVELYNQGKQRNYKVNFTNLEAGYYCLLFQPCARKCFETYLQSNVVKIEEKLIVTSKQNVIKETSTKRIYIAYICVVLILTLACCIVLYWNYKHRKIRKTPEKETENGSGLPFLPPTVTKASDTKVLVLYYPDEDTRRLVDILADFLQKCAEFNVTVIDDRLPDIHFNSIFWLDAVLQCCSTINGQCTCDTRFIIVMTEGVIKYMHRLRKAAKDLNELAKVKNGSSSIPSCSSDDDDMQADWFRYGLNRILIDWSKCLSDFTHFLVIYFDDTLYVKDDDVITIAPDVRFTLQRQHHLVKLCQELNDSFNDALLKLKLEDCLDKHPIKHIILDDLYRLD